MFQPSLFFLIFFLLCIFLFFPAVHVSSETDHAGLQDGEPKTCFTCHEDLSKPPVGGSVHDAFAMGDCTVCHELNESGQFRIVNTGGPVCTMCHEAMNTKTAVHGPVASGDCVLCHNPHQSANKKLLLKARISDLCFQCHDEEMAKQKQTHMPVADGECLNCHDPHQSDYSKQLVAEGSDLCFMCHPDKEDELKKKKHVHSAIGMMGCTGCHSPHGSNNWRMLRQPFPSSFYTPFQIEKYRLCFDCHDEALVLEKETTNATGFREGRTNLHVVHVNDSRKGRRCVVCHDVHGSKGPKLVREAAPFGKWQIPIRFEIMEDGGRCITGCHVPRSYHRLEHGDKR